MVLPADTVVLGIKTLRRQIFRQEQGEQGVQLPALTSGACRPSFLPSAQRYLVSLLYIVMEQQEEHEILVCALMIHNL